MKKYIAAFVIGIIFLIPIVTESEGIITSMRVKDPTGKKVTVSLDACYDPVTQHWGPCYIVQSICNTESK